MAAAVASKVGVFNVVAHESDPFFSKRFDVQQRAAMRKPEFTVVGSVELKLEIHELMRSTDIELEVLKDSADIVTFKPQGFLHATRVDGACRHPFRNGELHVRIATKALGHQGQADPVLEVSAQEVFSTQIGQGLPGEVGQGEPRVEFS